MIINLRNLFIAGLTMIGLYTSLLVYSTKDTLWAFINVVFFFIIGFFIIYSSLPKGESNSKENIDERGFNNNE